MENICKNPLVGDRIPGFGDSFHLRKLRLGLKEYKIGASGGVRVVFMVHEEKKLVVPISCYKKGTYKRESQKINAIKESLRDILGELSGN